MHTPLYYQLLYNCILIYRHADKYPHSHDTQGPKYIQAYDTPVHHEVEDEQPYDTPPSVHHDEVERVITVPDNEEVHDTPVGQASTVGYVYAFSSCVTYDKF